MSIWSGLLSSLTTATRPRCSSTRAAGRQHPQHRRCRRRRSRRHHPARRCAEARPARQHAREQSAPAASAALPRRGRARWPRAPRCTAVLRCALLRRRLSSACTRQARQLGSMRVDHPPCQQRLQLPSRPARARVHGAAALRRLCAAPRVLPQRRLAATRQRRRSSARGRDGRNAAACVTPAAAPVRSLCISAAIAPARAHSSRASVVPFARDGGNCA